MRKRNLLLTCLVLLSLTGCGGSEEVIVAETPPSPPLHEVQTSAIWDNLTFSSITPVTSFESNGDYLKVFPYNDSQKYILVKQYLSSKNDAFSQLASVCTEESIVTKDNYTLYTTPAGVTSALISCEDVDYLVQTELPSYYCEMVCDMLCQLLGL